MNVVLAAIDDSTAAWPVLRTGQAFARLLEADLTAVHAEEPGKTTAVRAAEQAGVTLRVVQGDPATAIVQAATDPAVVLVVVGARGQPSDPRPAGHIATAVVEQIDTPVLVVPPEATIPDEGHPVRRALIPLEGTAETAEAVATSLRRLAGAGVELVGLHVFNAATVPRFWGEPGHTEQAFIAEFLARWCKDADVHLRLRRGAPPSTIVDVATTEGVDLIALGWNRRLGPDRAQVVQSALSRSCVPVLLVPIAPTGALSGPGK